MMERDDVREQFVHDRRPSAAPRSIAVRASCALLVALLGGCSADALDGSATVGTTADGISVALTRSGFTAAASPSDGGEGNLFDGNPSTRWSTGRAMAPGQWLRIDMGAAQTIDRIEMDSGASPGDYARGYEVYVSTDGASWGSAVATGAGTGQLVSVTFAARAARYIRVVQTGSAGNWWSIHELNVYNSGGTTGGTPLDRTAWSMTASPSGEDPRRAFDGDPSTRWSAGTAMTPGQWIRLDLGASQTFDRIEMDSGASPGDYARGYEVYVSTDGSTWGSAVATGAGTGQLVSVTFAARAARYIRVVQTGSAGNWWSIHELNVYNSGGTSGGGGGGGGIGSRLRVVTWNLQHCNNVALQAQRLADQNPQVVITEETPDWCKDSLRSELSTRTGASWQMTWLEEVAVLSRLRVNSAESRTIGISSWGGNRTAVRVEVDVNGAPVNVFGTHLDWNPSGDMTNHIENRRQLLAWVDSVGPRKVLGGDMNAWTWGPSSWEGDEQRVTIAAFDARMTDVCSSLRGSHDACNGDPTNGGWLPDYIYRSSGLGSTGYTVVSSAGLSDHNLVVVDLTIQ